MTSRFLFGELSGEALSTYKASREMGRGQRSFVSGGPTRAPQWAPHGAGWCRFGAWHTQNGPFHAAPLPETLCEPWSNGPQAPEGPRPSGDAGLGHPSGGSDSISKVKSRPGRTPSPASISAAVKPNSARPVRASHQHNKMLSQ